MKRIRFNLWMAGRPVRSLADLQRHFNVDDALALARNGTLERWLEVCGHEQMAAAVADAVRKTASGGAELPPDVVLSLARSLVETIVSPAGPHHDLERLSWGARYAAERVAMQRALDARDAQSSAAIRRYHEEFDARIEELARIELEPWRTWSLVNGVVAKDFARLVQMNVPAFYERVWNRNPLGIIAALFDPDLKKALLGSEEIAKRIRDAFSTITLSSIAERAAAPAALIDHKVAGESWVTVWNGPVVVKMAPDGVELRPMGEPLVGAPELTASELHRGSFMKGPEAVGRLFSGLEARRLGLRGNGNIRYAKLDDDAGLGLRRRLLRGGFVRIFARPRGEVASKHFSTLIDAGVRVVVLRMEADSRVRSPIQPTREYATETANRELPELDGLEYHSGNANNELYCARVPFDEDGS